ncbi:DNA replication and repair protein RecF [Idiomarina fontislapidosi]|uniref:DNA replication and repair protein RecF n=1 Tax=Idiomarina fontislapidosi TaxID=263723 RepID=A0A432XP08_9GAMM|nr:DNA replication/repair protein RecF [Idiomarina fontislapidosi]PYE30478.1 DNA replication and repair protein RecF [Idiomarina fontislapidosi]RUO50412.1 DNA replication/repair protein RecF [Idiomarina fontislapidosi]|tara:strand:- start:362 stop:1450 length:1089 start_codon:yes stop_codon:yes gene_type:complete
MRLNALKTNNFRNFKRFDLEPSPSANLIGGVNGSGKTSLIEAIYLLGFGRSFRPGGYKQLINHNESEFTVFCEALSDVGEVVKLGVRRTSDGETQLRLNGDTVHRLSEIARHIPVQLFTPESVELILSGPSLRRQFMDWGVFHVEHSFYELWVAYTKSLKQRNHLLRSKGDPRQDSFWRAQLARLGQDINELRTRYIQEIENFITKSATFFLPDVKLEVSLKQGWEQNSDLSEALEKHTERDRRYGHTSVGPHKADLKLLIDGIDAKLVLSRGQLKLLVASLKLAQAAHYNAKKDSSCIFLVDDITSELDEANQKKFITALEQLGCQSFITAIDSEPVARLFKQNPRMFHVEHGILKQQTEN